MQKPLHKLEEKEKPKKKIKVWKIILHYVFFWPSIRKYTVYIYAFVTRKKKNKYNYWKN